jgi:hypothetical protein
MFAINKLADLQCHLSSASYQIPSNFSTLEQIAVTERLLSFGAESFDFQFAIQYSED